MARKPPPPPSLAEQLGAILIAHREATGQSRRQLADEYDLAANTLRELELGLANPTLERVEVAASMYGLRLALVAADGPVAAVTGRPVARAH